LYPLHASLIGVGIAIRAYELGNEVTAMVL
jgi:hypothetical protein